MRQHMVLWCIRQVLQGWEALHKPLKVRNDSSHLRLLQHDLRHPHTIRGLVLLPRQMLATMHVKPGEHTFTEVYGFSVSG